MKLGRYVVIPAAVLAAAGFFAVAPRWRVRAAADDHSVARRLEISGGELVRIIPLEEAARPALRERTLPATILPQNQKASTPNLPERPTMKLPPMPQRAERQTLVLPAHHGPARPERTSIVSAGH